MSRLTLVTGVTGRVVGRFIFTSTNLVYGAGRGRPAREDDELHPSAMLQNNT